MSTTVVETACTLDCPDTCSLAVTVTGGVISKIDAGAGNPLTDGWICAKVKQHARRVYSPERVRVPRIRIGPKGSGEFREATWDEALDAVAGRIGSARALDPSSVVGFTYNSSAGANEADGLTEALLAALGSARAEHTICAATYGAAWRSVFPGMLSADPLDVVHAQLIVIWGANPTVSNTHFPPLVREAVQRGARVVVVDPRRTGMAKRADLHLAVRPGTDVVLAFAVAAEWDRRGLVDHDFVVAHATGADEFLAAAREWTIDRAADVCGLPPTEIERFADWYGTTRPAMLRMGWGQERNANGGAACRALLALPVLANHFGVLGSGVIGTTSSASPVDTARRWPGSAGSTVARRTVNMHQIGLWLAPGSGDPCRVLFIQGSNPAVMCPDSSAVHQALARDDVFTVVHEQVMTDTTRFADVVLPATTAFEVDDVARSYGSFTVQPVRAVIERVGESRSNDEVGLALAQRLGFDWSWPTIASVDDAGPRVVRGSTVQFVDTVPRDGRARLVDPAVGVPVYVPLASPAAMTPSYPLTLISPATSKLVSSMFGEFQSPTPTVMLHPLDASARSLVAGQEVDVVNERGSVRVMLVVSDETRPGVAVAPKGVWLREYNGGTGVNTLIPATADALAAGACFNDARVEVVAC